MYHNCLLSHAVIKDNVADIFLKQEIFSNPMKNNSSN